MEHINIEIKARLPKKNTLREILTEHDAEYKWTDHQIDTYYKVEVWRLKIREWTIENYLIHYNRINQKWPKKSTIILHHLEKKSKLKEILNKSHKILALVDKKREIYYINNIKIHIDSVMWLWNFVEIEARDTKGNIWKDKLLSQCEYYMNLLKIEKNDLIKESYSDLILIKE